jgi:hypothetical protein
LGIVGKECSVDQYARKARNARSDLGVGQEWCLIAPGGTSPSVTAEWSAGAEICGAQAGRGAPLLSARSRSGSNLSAAERRPSAALAEAGWAEALALINALFVVPSMWAFSSGGCLTVFAQFPCWRAFLARERERLAPRRYGGGRDV